MKLSSMVKKLAALDLAVGIIIVSGLWIVEGPEWMAAKFCNLTHVEMCNEVEWSDPRMIK